MSKLDEEIKKYERILDDLRARKDGLISTHSNSKVGSQHWYNTLCAKVSHVGEFMQTDHELTKDRREDWGKMVQDIMHELIDNYQSIQEHKE